MITQNNIDIELGGKGFQNIFDEKYFCNMLFEKKTKKLEHNRKKSQMFEPNRVVQSKNIIADVEYHIAFHYVTKNSLGEG